MRIFNDRNAEKSIFFYNMLYGLCIEMSFHFVILFFNVESGTHAISSYEDGGGWCFLLAVKSKVIGTRNSR